MIKITLCIETEIKIKLFHMQLELVNNKKLIKQFNLSRGKNIKTFNFAGLKCFQVLLLLNIFQITQTETTCKIYLNNDITLQKKKNET